MCLSAQALALFLGLLPPEIVTVSVTEVEIRAEVGPVVWTNYDAQWCTLAPMLDRPGKEMAETDS